MCACDPCVSRRGRYLLAPCPLSLRLRGGGPFFIQFVCVCVRMCTRARVFLCLVSAGHMSAGVRRGGGPAIPHSLYRPHIAESFSVLPPHFPLFPFLFGCPKCIPFVDNMMICSINYFSLSPLPLLLCSCVLCLSVSYPRSQSLLFIFYCAPSAPVSSLGIFRAEIFSFLLSLAPNPFLLLFPHSTCVSAPSSSSHHLLAVPSPTPSPISRSFRLRSAPLPPLFQPHH